MSNEKTQIISNHLQALHKLDLKIASLKKINLDAKENFTITLEIYPPDYPITDSYVFDSDTLQHGLLLRHFTASFLFNLMEDLEITRYELIDKIKSL
jgi:hypothetical protein